MHGERRLFFGLCLCVALLVGCMGKVPFFQGPYLTVIDPTQTVEGPLPVISSAFEEIDLACLLDGKTNGDLCGEKKYYFSSKNRAEYQVRLRKARNRFYENDPNERKRNSVQDHIIAASNQRCGQYKQFLKRHEIASNLTLGAIATITAGAGAIFTASDTVRALSGISGIFSGLRAEVGAVVFQTRTIQVLTKGLEARRREIYAEILKERRKSLSQYTVERAIGDAISYHDHCSLIAGLEYTALSIEYVDNPGIKQLRKTIDELTRVQLSMRKLNVASAEEEPPEILLVVQAFAGAEKVKDQLEKRKGSLEAKESPAQNLDNERKALINDMNALLKKANTEVLTEANKTNASVLEQALQQSITAVYSASDSTARIALAELRTKRDEARTAISKYNMLKESMQEQIDRADNLLRKIESANTATSSRKRKFDRSFVYISNVNSHRLHRCKTAAIVS